MLTPIDRSAVFKNSPAIDCYVASLQAYYSRELEETDLDFPRFDHCNPFNSTLKEPLGFSAFGWAASTRAAYEKEFPARLALLFETLGAGQPILLHWLKVDLLSEYPFESPSKRERFKSYGAIHGDSIGYSFELMDFEEIFDLFLFHADHDSPGCLLFSSTSDIFLGMYLCDDGNIHLTHYQKDEAYIRTCAESLGFLAGDPALLCNTISIHFLKESSCATQ
ncbi:hypothetical protein LZF95_02030 [Algoriphagus sp. AGSA1]|uniref:hypothetical protein n=1 Tax=Algoriphagus sp. AGSA1 TaxID=2907213 RepID=UPI001F38BF84|nr:hypothetical protein [Algoriphagus sp. AGSA1]MCE7053438.1 hypothetical protein [Algoriphagus sp. AGSA1]